MAQRPTETEKMAMGRHMGDWSEVATSQGRLEPPRQEEAGRTLP